MYVCVWFNDASMNLQIHLSICQYGLHRMNKSILKCYSFHVCYWQYWWWNENDNNIRYSIDEMHLSFEWKFLNSMVFFDFSLWPNGGNLLRGCEQRAIWHKNAHIRMLASPTMWKIFSPSDKTASLLCILHTYFSIHVQMLLPIKSTFSSHWTRHSWNKFQ